jgi:hypothetical protein
MSERDTWNQLFQKLGWWHVDCPSSRTYACSNQLILSPNYKPTAHYLASADATTLTRYATGFRTGWPGDCFVFGHRPLTAIELRKAGLVSNSAPFAYYLGVANMRTAQDNLLAGIACIKFGDQTTQRWLPVLVAGSRVYSPYSWKDGAHTYSVPVETYASYDHLDDQIKELWEMHAPTNLHIAHAHRPVTRSMTRARHG